MVIQRNVQQRQVALLPQAAQRNISATPHVGVVMLQAQQHLFASQFGRQLLGASRQRRQQALAKAKKQ